VKRVLTSYGMALLLPWILVPAAIWSGGRAEAYMMHTPSIGCAAGISTFAPNGEQR
jgi:hypothetical protein